VRREQARDLFQNFRLAGAGRLEKRGPLGAGTFERLMEEFPN
jgi:hypothetical protein